MRRFVLFIVFPLLAMPLAACQPPAEPDFPDIRFDQMPPIDLDVAEIVVKTPYQEPLEPPHVGQEFPVPPSRAARNWVDDRLRAVGSRGAATVTINEASAVETDLKRTTGLTGLLTKDQAQSYEVRIEITIEATDPVGPRTASASMRVTKKTSVSEDATFNDREETWYQLTKDTMDNFNKAMVDQMHQSLSGFIK
jgi:hypothetical protein